MKAVATQITLWNEIPRVPATLTTAQLVPSRNQAQELVGESLRLLPISAGKDKTGKIRPSLKQQNPNLTPRELKELHKSQGMEMKAFLGAVALSLASNPDVVGLGTRVGRNGRVTLAYKKDVPQVDILTDEELAMAMGRTVEWVRQNRKERPVTVELELQKASAESKPNGKVINAPAATPAN